MIMILMMMIFTTIIFMTLHSLGSKTDISRCVIHLGGEWNGPLTFTFFPFYIHEHIYSIFSTYNAELVK